MFGTKDVKLHSTSKYLGWGVQELKITSFGVRQASTGSQSVTLNVEGRPVDEEGWEGEDGAAGQVGRVQLGSWLKTESQQKEFNENITRIATALGVLDEVNAIEAADLEEYIAAVTPHLCNKWMRMKVVVKEYRKGDGNIGKTLHTARFNFVESTEQEGSKLTFDMSNEYDYEKLKEQPDAVTTNGNGSENDLPF